MSDPANYTTDEESRLILALRHGGAISCPRCGSRMERRDVDPRSDVSYVRKRVWLACDRCRRVLVVDRAR